MARTNIEDPIFETTDFKPEGNYAPANPDYKDPSLIRTKDEYGWDNLDAQIKKGYWHNKKQG